MDMEISANRTVRFVYFVAVVLILCSYIFTSVFTSGGEIIMPLDDAYIHFQYAKQTANGQPYIYNPGDAPTSGATSFIYPYLLAIGYAIGFDGLNLGMWALTLGAASLMISMRLIYLLARVLDVPHWLAFLGGLLFALSGPVSWHYMSGMETGLMIAFTLAVLYAFVSQQFNLLIAMTTLCS